MNDWGDHIYVWDDWIDPSIIDQCHEDYHKCMDLGMVVTRKTAIQVDEQLFYPATVGLPYETGFFKVYTKIQTEIIPELINQYPSLDGNYDNIFVSGMKIQRTKLKGGYHSWHTEHCSGIDSHTTLFAYTLYLNDVHEGGETEFLYQGMRMNPVKNRFVVWPAGFTHMHRGNPPLSNEKIIITGWISYA